MCMDISDIRETEKMLKKSYEEQTRLLASETAAKEASRLKSEFTANLSHEIRTPISKSPSYPVKSGNQMAHEVLLRCYSRNDWDVRAALGRRHDGSTT